MDSQVDVKRELEKLHEAIKNCKKCNLYKSRKNSVPGEGPANAKIMIIGEAPGEKEDEMGRPFVGAAGKLLTNLLEERGLKRSQVFITNILKCRPPGNRDPAPQEVEACKDYLIKQIKIIKPKIIVTLGRHATSFILNSIGVGFKSMRKSHGRIIKGDLYGVPVIIFVTYHPAAALYNPRLKKNLEADFDILKKVVDENIKQVSKRRTLEDFFYNI